MDGNHWHLDRRVNIGHLLTTLVIAGTAFLYIQKFDQRISVLEATVEQRADYQRRTNEQVTQELRTINSKLDRLIERLAER